jgi:hypothetical protein
MILANLHLVVNTFNTIAMIITSVPLISVIRPQDAITLQLNVTMEIYVLMIIVILILVVGSLHFLLVTMVTHVPMNIATAIQLDFAFTNLEIVMIMMLVPKIPVVLLLDVPILKLLAKITMLVLKILVIKLSDVYSLISQPLAKQIISAKKIIVAQ